VINKVDCVNQTVFPGRYSLRKPVYYTCVRTLFPIVLHAVRAIFFPTIYANLLFHLIFFYDLTKCQTLTCITLESIDCDTQNRCISFLFTDYHQIALSKKCFKTSSIPNQSSASNCSKFCYNAML
jgi:hypothetical protein